MWQAIDSAPRDRTPVDLWVVYSLGPARRITDCFYRVDEWLYWEDAEDGRFPWPVGGSPTHWMPVPEKPNV